jgi:hypothetical protein
MAKKRTGLCQVYICHSEGFSGHLRPAYDSAPRAKAEMTDKQVQTMANIIQKYMMKCRASNSTLQEGKETDGTMA